MKKIDYHGQTGFIPCEIVTIWRQKLMEKPLHLAFGVVLIKMLKNEAQMQRGKISAKSVCFDNGLRTCREIYKYTKIS